MSLTQRVPQIYRQVTSYLAGANADLDGLMAVMEVIQFDEEGGSEPQTVAEKRRAQIVDAAIRLFAERGYFQTTIEDVASAVPISKGLVYRYFKDKNDLLFFTLQYVIDKYNLADIDQLISKSGALDVLMVLLRLHCKLATEHTEEVALAYRSTKDLHPEQRRQIKILESKIARVIRQCLESCIHSGLMYEFNTDIMSYQYIMFGHSWALKNWAFRDRYSSEEFMAVGEKILVQPFLTEAGRLEFEKLQEPPGG